MTLRAQGETFRGTADVLVAVNHLEGDFPGGVADPDYRFTLDDGLVTELEIGG